MDGGKIAEEGTYDELMRKKGLFAELVSRQQLESGKFDQAIAGMQPQDAAKFKQALANPQKLNQMLGSKQARALYEKLTKGS